MMRAVSLALALGLAVITSAVAQSVTVQITDAWIRWLPGSLPAGGYLTVVNSGDRPVSLTGASCDEYARVTLHQSRQQGGVASMVPVSALTIAPHSRLAFESAGYHLMLEQPKKPIRPGDRMTVTIHFGSDLAIPVAFEVRPPGAS
jgi:periplasmic copper chaperone A